MTLNEAIKKRLDELIKEKDIKMAKLSLNSGLTPSTIFDFLYGKTKYPKIITLYKICLGADITLNEFFDKDYFNDIEE